MPSNAANSPTIREVTSEQQWEAFLRTLNPNTFLQSWPWGQVQQQTGEDVRHLGFWKNEQLVGVALVVLVNARRGRHYLIPHGPLLSSEQESRQALPALVEHLKSHAKHDRAVCLRLAPLLEDTPATRQAFADLKFRPAPLHVHAELTWVLDINKPADALLAGMRKTTRHAISKAHAEGAVADIITTAAGLKRFLPLYRATKTRHQFTPFSQHFLQTQVQAFLQREQLFFCIARHGEEDLAAAICIHYGHTVFYHHGASIHRPDMPPVSQLLQWTAIQEAARRGATLYNFWGIAPADQPRHPFAGITVFKKGFGGRAIDYLHAQDLPLSPRYWQLRAVEMWRKRRRGF
jgi:lipid II:glycine glycyltransferase (peptidoglycan interpeptide bridge formation enzyme)